MKADFGTLLLETHLVECILASLLLIYHNVSKCCRCMETCTDKRHQMRVDNMNLRCDFSIKISSVALYLASNSDHYCCRFWNQRCSVMLTNWKFSGWMGFWDSLLLYHICILCRIINCQKN